MDEGWRYYVVRFEGPKSGMLIMTNSSNGEDMYDALLREILRDTFTPLEWEQLPADRMPYPLPRSSLFGAALRR